MPCAIVLPLCLNAQRSLQTSCSQLLRSWCNACVFGTLYTDLNNSLTSQNKEDYPLLLAISCKHSIITNDGHITFFLVFVVFPAMVNLLFLFSVNFTYGSLTRKGMRDEVGMGWRCWQKAEKRWLCIQRKIRGSEQKWSIVNRKYNLL